MATEDDKTNTGVAGTAIAVGVAAMIAGSSALVGMARTQVDEVSQDTQAYANLSSINDLKGAQAAKLAGAKVSIDKARQLTLSALKRDPDAASPWTPKPPPPEVTASVQGTDTAPSATGEVTSAPVAGSGETAPSSAPLETAASSAVPSTAPSAASSH